MRAVAVAAVVSGWCRGCDGGAAAYLTPEYIDKFAVRMWKDFKQDFNRESLYKGAGTEGSADHDRFLNFKDNLKRASELNGANNDATFGFNTYSDWFPDEFERVFSGGPLPDGEEVGEEQVGALLKNTKSANDVDWSRKDVVVHVKHQGNCTTASSVFAAVGALEAASAAAGRVLRPLSEQWVLSCAEKSTCDPAGAQRRTPAQVLREILRLGVEVPAEESYAYESFGGDAVACSAEKSVETGKGARPVSIVDLPAEDKVMRRWLDQKGPFAASLAAPVTSWQLYQEGVVQSVCDNTTAPTHSVLVVGYGVRNSRKYWLVKNSWGSAWGEHGYARVSRGKGCLQQPVAVTAQGRDEAPEGGEL